MSRSRPPVIPPEPPAAAAQRPAPFPMPPRRSSVVSGGGMSGVNIPRPSSPVRVGGGYGEDKKLSEFELLKLVFLEFCQNRSVYKDMQSNKGEQWKAIVHQVIESFKFSNPSNNNTIQSAEFQEKAKFLIQNLWPLAFDIVELHRRVIGHGQGVDEAKVTVVDIRKYKGKISKSAIPALEMDGMGEIIISVLRSIHLQNVFTKLENSDGARSEQLLALLIEKFIDGLRSGGNLSTLTSPPQVPIKHIEKENAARRGVLTWVEMARKGVGEFLPKKEVRITEPDDMGELADPKARNDEEKSGERKWVESLRDGSSAVSPVVSAGASPMSSPSLSRRASAAAGTASAAAAASAAIAASLSRPPLSRGASTSNITSAAAAAASSSDRRGSHTSAAAAAAVSALPSAPSVTRRGSISHVGGVRPTEEQIAAFALALKLALGMLFKGGGNLYESRVDAGQKKYVITKEDTTSAARRGSVSGAASAKEDEQKEPLIPTSPGHKQVAGERVSWTQVLTARKIESPESKDAKRKILAPAKEYVRREVVPIVRKIAECLKGKDDNPDEERDNRPKVPYIGIGVTAKICRDKNGEFLGLKVLKVHEGSPAAASGLEVGQFIDGYVDDDNKIVTFSKETGLHECKKLMDSSCFKSVTFCNGGTRLNPIQPSIIVKVPAAPAATATASSSQEQASQPEDTVLAAFDPERHMDILMGVERVQVLLQQHIATTQTVQEPHSR